jgi:NAD(P)-dependent dehydrogenase (short-subunit alcohol dehydrogenase family)
MSDTPAFKSVLITGASTGIGQATALHLSSRGFIVYAGVRKAADTKGLTEPRFGKRNGEIRPIILDVANPDQIAAAVDQIAQDLGGWRLNGLVNNAGIAVMGPLAVQPMSEVRQHFEVNFFGLLAMCQAFAPLLGTDTSLKGPPGRIVNITSVGGKVPSPFLGAYTATKHAVESVTTTLRMELSGFSIDAISVGPGAVKTPIWDKSKAQGTDVRYKDGPWGTAIARFEAAMYEAGRTGLPVEHIASVIESALTAAKPKTRYAPVPNKLVNFILPTLLPQRMIDKAFIDMFGLKDRDN